MSNLNIQRIGLLFISNFLVGSLIYLSPRINRETTRQETAHVNQLEVDTLSFLVNAAPSCRGERPINHLLTSPSTFDLSDGGKDGG